MDNVCCKKKNGGFLAKFGRFSKNGFSLSRCALTLAQSAQRNLLLGYVPRIVILVMEYCIDTDCFHRRIEDEV